MQGGGFGSRIFFLGFSDAQDVFDPKRAVRESLSPFLKAVRTLKSSRFLRFVGGASERDIPRTMLDQGMLDSQSEASKRVSH